MMLCLITDVCQGQAVVEWPRVWPVLSFPLLSPCDGKNEVVQKAETVVHDHFKNEASKAFM